MKSIKGFTLVELLAVIIILSLLALVAGTAVTKLVKDSKEDLYNTQLMSIKESAQIWGAQNMSLLPDSGECIYITLKNLIDSGVMDDVIDPRTKEPMDDNLQIKITSSTSELGSLITKYEVNPTSVSECTYPYSS